MTMVKVSSPRSRRGQRSFIPGDYQMVLRDRVSGVIRRGDLTAVFQPIIRIESTTIIGAEALARFPGEPVRPDRWFADAASVGMGKELELAAISATFAADSRLSPNVYLSINPSPSLLCSPGLDTILGTSDPTRVVVELTEHAAVEDYPALLDVITGLRQLGARLAIDDVCAGFSSFQYGLQPKPEIVKADISFTRDLHCDRARQGLVRGLLGVTHGIGATVVAESVEDQDELGCLFNLGIDSVQGYFLARPGPPPLPTSFPEPTPRLIGGHRAMGDEVDALAFLARSWIQSSDLESVTRPLLDAVLDRTGLETSYLTVRDPANGNLEHRDVQNTGTIDLPAGFIVPWADSLCKWCRDADIYWTAEVPTNLPGREAAEALGVQTFVSIPVATADGSALGTLCAASTDSQFISATTIAEVQLMARLIADSLSSQSRGSTVDPPSNCHRHSLTPPEPTDR